MLLCKTRVELAIYTVDILECFFFYLVNARLTLKKVLKTLWITHFLQSYNTVYNARFGHQGTIYFSCFCLPIYVALTIKK